MTDVHAASPQTDGTTWSVALNVLNELVRDLAHANPRDLSALYAAAKTMAPYVYDGWIPKRDVADRLQNAAEAYGFVIAHGPDVVQGTLAVGLEMLLP
jgi:hypothetical protein